MDRLPVSKIPFHDFEDAKWEISGEFEKLMTDTLHSQHHHIDRSSIEADVKAFLGAHRFESALLNYSSAPRARSSLVRQRPVHASLARPKIRSIGSRRAPLFKTPTAPLARPRLTRASPVASSSSASTTASAEGFSSRPPSTPRDRRLPTRAGPVTPQSRRLLPTPQSRTPQTRRAHVSRPTMLTYGTLKNAHKECGGNIALMVSYLHELYPSIPIEDITQDVETVIATLR